MPENITNPQIAFVQTAKDFLTDRLTDRQTGRQADRQWEMDKQAQSDGQIER